MTAFRNLFFSSDSRSRRAVARRCGRVRRREASVTVETAFALTFLLLPLTVGMMQFGVVMSTGNQLEQISREAARYASVHATEPTFNASDTTPSSLRYYIKNLVVLQSTAIKWSDINATAVRPLNPATPATGYVAVIFANAMKSDGTLDTGQLQANSSAIVYGTPVVGQSVSVRIVYPMARKIFIGKIPWHSRVLTDPSTGQLKPDNTLTFLDNDYVSTSSFVIE